MSVYPRDCIDDTTAEYVCNSENIAQGTKLDDDWRFGGQRIGLKRDQ
jgi:hypothetical protein